MLRAVPGYFTLSNEDSLSGLTTYCRRFRRNSVCPVRFSIAFTNRIPVLVSFPAGTKMFQFPACPHSVECNSEILGSKAACASPRLFTACHVLHRHPSQAIPCMVLNLHSLFSEMCLIHVQYPHFSDARSPRKQSRTFIPNLRKPGTASILSTYEKSELDIGHRGLEPKMTSFV